jgi:hypothetical protein
LADSDTAASRKAESDCASQAQNDEADARRISKECCPITASPNDECEKPQCVADSKSEVLNDLIKSKN